MIGIIIPAVKGYVTPFDPDEAFDPTTHIASEEAFIQLLDHGVYDEKYIGYKVQLNNSVDYDGGTWIIADVNHDSENTGQSNCYDLISEHYIMYTTYFGSNRNYRDSNIRTMLNNTLYNGFSNAFKEHMINPKYNSQGIWYNDDKLVEPSGTEIGVNDVYLTNEGKRYPIFNYTPNMSSDVSRIKADTSGNIWHGWWTRSKSNYGSSYVYYVTTTGSVDTSEFTGDLECNLAPIIRVQ